MSTQQPSPEERDGSKGKGRGKDVVGEHAVSSFLPLTTTPPEPAAQAQTLQSAEPDGIQSHNAETAKGGEGDSHEPLPMTANTGLPEPPMKQEAATQKAPSTNEGAGHDRQTSTSSIWTSAAITLKNLVIGKPQTPGKDIVTVVQDPKAAAKRMQSVTSQSAAAKVDKGKGKATAPEEIISAPAAENVLPVLNAPERPTQSYDSKSKAQSRPSAPPPRLSFIAHSLPTTSSHPPPASHASQSTTSPSSLQSPNSTTSNATATSATTATDEENEAAALAALNAVIHSVGTGYTQPLTSRAAQLHANDQMLAQQRERLLHTSALLAKDTAVLQKLAQESNNKLKSFGDLHNWSETLDNDLNAIEETLRLVEHGTLETCSKCEMGIDEEEAQRWCGECGKGFHLVCAGEDPDEVLTSTHGPGLGDDDDHIDTHEHDTHDPANVALPSSLPWTSRTQHQPNDLAAMSSLFSAFSPAATAPQASVPSVPKPSSMFEWGGIPDSVRLEDEEGSESESSSSEWSGEDWRCQECRLKDDLDAIGRGL